MTNTIQYLPEKYLGNSLTRDFPFKFKGFDEAYLDVYIEDENGKQTTLELDVDYDVLVSDSGGNIVLKEALPEGKYIIIARKVPNIQDITYSTSTGFSAKTVENGLDKNVAMIQQLAYDNARSIKIPVGSDTLNLTLPKPLKGKTLKWNDDETGLINSISNIDEIGEAVEQAITSSNGAIQAAANAQNIVDTATSAINAKVNKAEELLSETISYAQKAKFYAERTEKPLTPFCVNSGIVDLNGESAVMKFEENILTAQAPFVYTLANGCSYRIVENLTLDISTLMLNSQHYNVFLNHDNSTLAVLDNYVYAQKMIPVEAKENDIWFNVSCAPFTCLIYSGTEWIECNYVPLGEILISETESV